MYFWGFFWFWLVFIFLYFVIQENVDPSLESETENQPVEEAGMQRRELTPQDEQQIWKDITLTQYMNTHARCRETRGPECGRKEF